MSLPQPQSSLRSVALVTGLTFVQLLFQFATQLVLAKFFGAGGEMDAYVAALAPPVVVAAILSGSLGYVLVPVFSERRVKHGERDAATVGSQIGLSLLALSLLASVAMAVAALPLTTILFPGFSPDQRQLTGELLQLLSTLILANSLIAFLNALFHCYRRFTLPAVAGVAGTVVTLAYVILLHERQGIHAVAWGVVLGAAVTAAILLPLFIWQLGQSAWWVSPHPGALRCLRLLLPLLAGALFWRLDPLLDRLLGSYLTAGSLSHLGYAWRLTSALMMIGTSGLSIVAFPAIAAHAAAGEHHRLNIEIAYAIRFLLFLIVPVCAGLALFSEPVVQLLFERGKFTPADTSAVALLVVLYVGVIVGATLSDVLSRTMYALHDMRTPVVVSIVGFALAAGLKLLLVAPLGAAGLAAATSCYHLFNAVVLAAILLRVMGSDMLAGATSCVLRSLASSALACMAAWIVMKVFLPGVPAAAVTGALVYIVVMRLWGDEFASKAQRFLFGWRP